MTEDPRKNQWGKSHWCQKPLTDTESHGWCMNRSPEESHCTCVCHAQRSSRYPCAHCADSARQLAQVTQERDALKAERDELADQHYGKMRRALTNRAEHAEAQGAALLAALKAIVETGDDCPACDRGVLRHPENGHWPKCPFGRALEVMALLTAPPQTEPK